MGRKPSLTLQQAQAARETAVAAGEGKASIARRLGISRQTLYRVLAGGAS
ncbi:MAG: Hin recombinase [Desulfarculus sp.]|nr:Hin recombinase [Desulfarculus sp.]